MKKYLDRTIAIFLVSTVVVSCGSPKCKNTNSTFDRYSPETREYKNELVKELKRVDHSKLVYTLDKYQEDDSLQYLHVLIQGDGLCAKGVVTIKKWDDKLEGIRKTKGIGYSGAELKNLRVDMYQDSTKTELIYQSLDTIID